MHGASLGCGWRRRPPDIESSCENLVLQLGVLGKVLTTHHHKKNSLLQNVTKGLGFGRIFWKDIGNGKWI
jgi:hypothetical protein